MVNIAHSKSLLALAANAAQYVLAVVALSLVVFTYERGLVPLYGSGPTNFLLDKILLAAIAVSAVQPFKISLSKNRLYTALALTLAPNASYWVAVWTARKLKDPVLGPAITHAVVLGPLAFILSTFVMEAYPPDGPANKNARPSLLSRLIRLGATYFGSYRLATRAWTRVALLSHISESRIYLLLAGIAYCGYIALYPLGPGLATTPRNKKQKQKVAPKARLLTKSGLVVGFIAFWFSIHEQLANPVLPHPLLETYTHPSEPLQIHSAVESVTGLITVGESLPPPGYNVDGNDMHSARYLRASHSILGGVWMGDKVQVIDNEPPLRDSFGTPLGDSIYATFVLQEAARLVNSTEKGRTGKWSNALVIGLGSGISATSFMRHGISTTIVEIDPAVYEAARTFFGLPDPGPGKVFLEDARTWVANERASIETGHSETHFDIVVHDCFSGGGVPKHIFTSEFWEDLKFVMQPDGVLVVNFAGIIRSESSRMIIHTLEKSFGQCRAFHDMFAELPDDMYDTEFINMVIFCTRSPRPITFRNARNSDYLGSPLRRFVLESLPSREVNLETIRVVSDDTEGSKYLLRDAHNELGKLQEEQGNHHWTVMREVLPDVHWETY